MKKRFDVKSVLLLLVVTLGLFALAILPQVMTSDVFAEGIKIGKVDVSGMTRSEGIAALNETIGSNTASMSINVVVNEEITILTADKLGISMNILPVLDEAYNYDKSGDIRNDFNARAKIKKKGKDFPISPNVDEETLKDSIRLLAMEYEKPPFDAQATFVPELQNFTYVDSKEGSHIDAESLSNTILERINNMDFSRLEIVPEAISPNLSTENVKNATKKLSNVETIAFDNNNRNKNIRTAAAKLDGYMLKSGETLSLNELLGERNKENGYFTAPEIYDERKEYGGGISQFAGTVHSAALKAKLEVVERTPMSEPVDYLKSDESAYLRYDSSDLKLKNTTDFPLYFSAKLDGNLLKVTIFGSPN